MHDALALYIHWPFCLSKCPYCDFNSHVRERIDQGRFAAALLAELQHEAARVGRRPLASIFFGGGTPSLMAPETTAALVQAAFALFDPLPDCEVTLEANPTSVEAGKLRGFRAAGVNRLSLGVQSLDEAALAFLGRKHSRAEAVAALEAARAIFPRLSFDLIYARPGQQEAAWRAELRQALALAADHLSLYQLTIEPGTRFATEYARGAFALPADDDAARMYEATAEEAARFGMAGYEVSNYAKPGAESRHNLAYWRYGDYLGIGPGAHQRLLTGAGMRALRRHRAPEEWASLVETRGEGSVEVEALTAQDCAREALLMGLRLTEGVAPARFLARTGTELRAALHRPMLEACLEEGYLAWLPDGALAASTEGRLRLDALLPRLLL